MSRKRPLPIGVDNFRELRERNYYYVDKSHLIKEMLDNQAKVTLITRPRRFGKTLNMTMLREFFAINSDSRDIFAGLNIMSGDYADEINSRPVIFLSFRDSKGDTAEELLRRMFAEMAHEYDKVDELPELETKINKKLWQHFQAVYAALRSKPYAVDLTDQAIVLLCQVLYEYYGKRVILLIDEYDTPMSSAYEGKYYEQLRSFFRNLYATALKGNDYLDMAMLTGIQRVAKENIFSGLNNLKVCTVIHPAYSSCFGLTEAETKTMLGYYGRELNDEVKAMYDGYNFAGQEVYNPWSIINYAAEGLLISYWVNTSSNAMIHESIASADASFYQKFEQLIERQSTSVRMVLDSSFQEIKATATLWGLLMNGGYITLGSDYDVRARTYPIRIPNEEVKREFQIIVSHYIGINENSLIDMFESLLKKDIPAFTAIYRQIVLEKTSYFDKDKTKENPYHMLMLGMCAYLDGWYEVTSNREGGYGRHDIQLKAKNPERHINVIIEFKQGAADELPKLAGKALEQIKAQKYYAGLSGETLLLGIAHDIKHCEIVSELIGRCEQ